MDLENILACGPDAGQQPEDNQIYNSRFWVTASQINMFPWKKLNSNRRTVFSMRSVPKGYERDKFRV
jgi:hypothetical protein